MLRHRILAQDGNGRDWLVRADLTRASWVYLAAAATISSNRSASGPTRNWLPWTLDSTTTPVLDARSNCAAAL